MPTRCDKTAPHGPHTSYSAGWGLLDCPGLPDTTPADPGDTAGTPTGIDLTAAYDDACQRVSEMNGWDYDDQARAAVDAALPHITGPLAAELERTRADRDRLLTAVSHLHGLPVEHIIEAYGLNPSPVEGAAAPPATPTPEAPELAGIVRAKRRLDSALIAVSANLDIPYKDRPELTPWTRFIQPAMARLDAALAAAGPVGSPADTPDAAAPELSPDWVTHVTTTADLIRSWMARECPDVHRLMLNADYEAMAGEIVRAGWAAGAVGDTRVEWGIRLTWTGDGTTEDMPRDTRDQAERTVAIHTRARSSDPAWQVTAQLIQRTHHTGPWVPAADAPTTPAPAEPATCTEDDCTTSVSADDDHRCGGTEDGGPQGCGRLFCLDHLYATDRDGLLCSDDYDNTLQHGDEPGDPGDPIGYEIIATRLHRDGLGALRSGDMVATIVSTRPTLADAVAELLHAITAAAGTDTTEGA